MQRAIDVVDRHFVRDAVDVAEPFGMFAFLLKVGRLRRVGPWVGFTHTDHDEADSEPEGDDVIRLAGDGGWALASSTSGEMLRWETLYDGISEGWPMIALCQIDLTRFAGDVVIDSLRAHPLCIMGTVLVPNSLHEDPARLLEELAERS